MRKRYSTVFTARLSDFDLQGILNSKCYVDFLAEARLDQMVNHYLIPFDHYSKKNQTWVLSNLQIAFSRPIFFPQSFVVETEVTAIEGSRADVDFVFKRTASEVVHASGKASYHFVDLTTKRPVPIPPDDANVFLSVP
jgi:acyl-CoA thioesterase FadM